MKQCLNCGKELDGRKEKYCCRQCQTDYQQKQYIEAWHEGKEDGLSGEYQLSKRIKRYLLEKHNYQCEKCGWGEINTYTGTIPLEIHHKDGNYKNNTEENLEVLCPNCHSLTATYKSANKNGGRSERKKYIKIKPVNKCKICGKEISYKASFCLDCSHKQARVIERPSRDELKQMIRTIPFTHIAELYGVSDKAIVKWCIAENLPSRKADIKRYTDDEWKQI